MMFQLTFAMYSIKVRVEVLNELLNQYFPTEHYVLEAKTKQVKDLKEVLKSNITDEIIDMHDQLSDGILLINSTFTFQMIPIISVFLSHGIFALHSLVKEYLVTSEFFWDLVFNNLFWFSYYMMIICFMVSTGSKTSNTLRKTSVLVFKITNQLKDPFLLERFKMLSQQIDHREKVIKNAFFSIDWSLMFQVRFNEF